MGLFHVFGDPWVYSTSGNGSPKLSYTENSQTQNKRPGRASLLWPTNSGPSRGLLGPTARSVFWTHEKFEPPNRIFCVAQPTENGETARSLPAQRRGRGWGHMKRARAANKDLRVTWGLRRECAGPKPRKLNEWRNPPSRFRWIPLFAPCPKWRHSPGGRGEVVRTWGSFIHWDKLLYARSLPCVDRLSCETARSASQVERSAVTKRIHPCVCPVQFAALYILQKQISTIFLEMESNL